ncbi:MAG: DUF3307 domain-containing protein [Chitinophagaceae bacterium]
MSTLWLIKMILSHLLTDFLLQKRSWIADRKMKHFLSGYLYVHTIITALFVLVFAGTDYWLISIIIFITHTLIDGWKSYQSDKAVFFLVDQAMHFIVILICWLTVFYNIEELKTKLAILNAREDFWIILTSAFFLTIPSAILIGEVTKQWRNALDSSDTLGQAGRWIGIVERIVILMLVLENQYEAVGLLVAAKTIIRFSDTNRTEQKTEYLLIGTLMSIGLAMFTGMVVNRLIR